MHLGLTSKEQFAVWVKVSEYYLKKKGLTEQEREGVRSLGEFLCPDAPARNVVFRHPSSE